jgi:UDP-N-acetylmuramate dehydrogenase
VKTAAPGLFLENIPLAPYTTFGVGGPAALFASINSLAEMQQALAFCSENGIPFIVLGKGSNCLFDDRGFQGAVLLNKLNTLEDDGNGCFTVGSGYSFARLGSGTARKGWSGLEFASGIPGTMGGAVYMNAGANGSDTASILTEVLYLHADGAIQKYERNDLQFAYRHSPFQNMQGAILQAKVQLTACAEAKSKQHTMLAYRTSTQPYGEKSAGCVFRNPEGTSAGALIDHCGLKGITQGGAVISPQHANFIVNQGGATAQDILGLMQIIRTTIRDKVGIDLVSEICYIPYQREE